MALPALPSPAACMLRACPCPACMGCLHGLSAGRHARGGCASGAAAACLADATGSGAVTGLSRQQGSKRSSLGAWVTLSSGTAGGAPTPASAAPHCKRLQRCRLEPGEAVDAPPQRGRLHAYKRSSEKQEKKMTQCYTHQTGTRVPPRAEHSAPVPHKADSTAAGVEKI